MRPPALPLESIPSVDINAIVKAVIQETIAANAAFTATNPTSPSLAPTPTQPMGGHQPSPPKKFFLKDWNGDLDSLPAFQACICAWFESPYLTGVTDFTKTLPGTEYQRFLLRLQLMSGLLPEKILSTFLQNPVYKRGGFRMWGRIREKYDPRGKDALFESVSALYTL